MVSRGRWQGFVVVAACAGALLASVVAGCSGDDSTGTTGDAAAEGAATTDAQGGVDTGTVVDGGSSVDSGGNDTGVTDAAKSDASDAGFCTGTQTTCSPDGGARYCANTQVDNTNCGTCGNVCSGGTACSQGKCSKTCGGNETLCTPDAGADGGAPYCADLQSDHNNCNACGHACAQGNVCVNGACQVSCPGTLVACGSTCIDPSSNPNFCGASGDCAGANAGTACQNTAHGTAVCSGGGCALICATGYAGADCASCAAGYQDNDANGTCTPACAANSCGTGTCSDASGTLSCLCRPGTMGTTCGTACPSGMAGAACDYSIVYQLAIPTGADWNVPAGFSYAIDNSGTVGTSFTRVAYRLILDSSEVWTEMDAFTTDPTKLGVPVDNVFQTNVTNEVVYAFSSNLTSTLTPTDGNIEFWSDCYSPTGGNNSLYDYSDTRSGGTDCYGSMQVFVNQSTVFGFDRWSSGGTIDIGIGNQPTGHPDWTFAQNASSFTTRTLEVYVK